MHEFVQSRLLIMIKSHNAEYAYVLPFRLWRKGRT